MTEGVDRDYLLREQYQNAGNLNARIELHKRFSVNKHGWQEWVFDQLELPQRGRLLELGCGPGLLWRENAARIPAGLKIVLSDFSAGMLAEARNNLAAVERPFEYIVADAQQIPCADAGFDIVIANHLLFYLADRPGTYANIRRVLRPGGRFYATTVGDKHMWEIRGLLQRFDPTIDYDRDFANSAAFTLENGAADLAGTFPSVEMRRFEDALLVTEAAPLTAYIMSMLRARPYSQAGRGEQVAQFVERELAPTGTLYVYKDSGVFIARRDGE